MKKRNLMNMSLFIIAGGAVDLLALWVLNKINVRVWGVESWAVGVAIPLALLLTRWITSGKAFLADLNITKAKGYMAMAVGAWTTALVGLPIFLGTGYAKVEIPALGELVTIGSIGITLLAMGVLVALNGELVGFK